MSKPSRRPSSTSTSTPPARRGTRRRPGLFARAWRRLFGATARAPRREPVDVVSQCQSALRHPACAALGGVLGGVVPFVGQAMAHHDVAAQWWTDPHAAVVAGCMLFSLLTVYIFGRAAFGDPRKAVGFCLAMELAMVATSLWYIRLLTLVVVIGINAVTTGARIALAYEAAERRRTADARRQATAAATRAARRAATQPQPQPAPVAPAARPAPVAPPVRPATHRAPAAARHATVMPAVVAVPSHLVDHTRGLPTVSFDDGTLYS